jgi:hypothetical protein
MKEKDWKEIALQYHILLGDLKYVLAKDFLPDATAERMIVSINGAVKENLPEIKRLNELELKGK